MMRNRRSGLTLLELLSVIGIIVVLIAILVPALIQSRKSAQQSSNLQKMQQLGHAWTLYLDEAGDYPPTPVALQAVANLPETIFSSTLDNDPKGIATSLCEAQPNFEKGKCLPFKRTFVMYTDSGGKWWYFKENILSESNAGWLFDPSRLKMNGNNPSAWSGPYQRLTVEGSVLTRHHQPVAGISKSGIPYLASHPGFLYCDPSDETRKKWLPQLP